MNKIQYFKIVKGIKQELINSGILNRNKYAHDFTIYSDKRSERSNGYRTKFWGIPGSKHQEVMAYITEN